MEADTGNTTYICSQALQCFGKKGFSAKAGMKSGTGHCTAHGHGCLLFLERGEFSVHLCRHHGAGIFPRLPEVSAIENNKMVPKHKSLSESRITVHSQCK